MNVLTRIAQRFTFSKKSNSPKRNNALNEGTVKFFNNAKGFGFITPADSETDVFVHVSGLVDKVREHDRVNFELEIGKKGMNAVNVKLLLG